jgi:excisionase family DNA binding protein
VTWLTVAQVADAEQVSPRTILRWIDAGELRARRQPGGRLRISSEWYADFCGDGRRVAVVHDEEAS